jgi:hypothetical protein
MLDKKWHLKRKTSLVFTYLSMCENKSKESDIEHVRKKPGSKRLLLR